MPSQTRVSFLHDAKSVQMSERFFTQTPVAGVSVREFFDGMKG
jgi:hypothetical protein